MNLNDTHKNDKNIPLVEKNQSKKLDLEDDDFNIDEYFNVSPEEEDRIFELINENNIPYYILDKYNWKYCTEKNLKFLNSNLLRNISSLYQRKFIESKYIEEINEGSKFLQIASAYGNLLNGIVKKIGPSGSLDLIDAVPLQISIASEKLEKNNNVDMWIQDATTPIHRLYDSIGMFFLLSEVPDHIKTNIIETSLKQIDESNGKLIIIDYHNPYFFNPLRSVLSLKNFIFNPYANSIWEGEIEDFCRPKFRSKYNWEKSIYKGGSYQKVVVTKKPE